MAATVQVKLLFFAKSRELAGEKQAVLGICESVAARGLLDLIIQTYPRLESIAENLILAHNQEYLDVQDTQPIRFQDGDELAVIPPISGG